MLKGNKKKIWLTSLGLVAITSIATIATACSVNQRTKLKLDKENTTAKDKNNNLYVKLSAKYDLNKLKTIPFKTVVEKTGSVIQVYPVNLVQNNDVVEFYLQLPEVNQETGVIIINPTGFFDVLPFILLNDQIKTTNTIELVQEGK